MIRNHSIVESVAASPETDTQLKVTLQVPFLPLFACHIRRVKYDLSSSKKYYCGYSLQHALRLVPSRRPCTLLKDSARTKAFASHTNMPSAEGLLHWKQRMRHADDTVCGVLIAAGFDSYLSAKKRPKISLDDPYYGDATTSLRVLQ